MTKGGAHNDGESRAALVWDDGHYRRLVDRPMTRRLSDEDQRLLLGALDGPELHMLQALEVLVNERLGAAICRAAAEESSIQSELFKSRSDLWAYARRDFLAAKASGDLIRWKAALRAYDEAVDACRSVFDQVDAAEAVVQREARARGGSARKALALQRHAGNKDAVQAFVRQKREQGLSRSRIVELGRDRFVDMPGTVFKTLAGDELPKSQKDPARTKKRRSSR